VRTGGRDLFDREGRHFSKTALKRVAEGGPGQFPGTCPMCQSKTSENDD